MNGIPSIVQVLLYYNLINQHCEEPTCLYESVFNVGLYTCVKDFGDGDSSLRFKPSHTVVTMGNINLDSCWIDCDVDANGQSLGHC